MGTHVARRSVAHQDRFCEAHAEPGFFDIVQQPCRSCGLMDVLTGDGKCTSCDPETRKRAERAKELSVKAFLDAREPRLQYISHDRAVDNAACVRYRPDFVFDAGTHAVVLEVDEHQHSSYACECEQMRMVNLAHALGYPTVFVRYNPDAYVSETGGRARKPERLAALAKAAPVAIEAMACGFDVSSI